MLCIRSKIPPKSENSDKRLKIVTNAGKVTVSDAFKLHNLRVQLEREPYN